MMPSDADSSGTVLGLDETAIEELERKAPLVDPDELVSVVVDRLLVGEVRERAATAWVLGSFVNPDKELDTGSAPSDIDVFIEITDWYGPPADSGMAMYADSVETPNVNVEETDRWRGQFAPDVMWACSADEAWEAIPDYVKPQRLWATEQAVFVTREEAKAGELRPFDLTIGNSAQRENHVEAKTGCCIWRK